MSSPAWARLQQLEADGHDDQLTLRARRRNPRLKHWWGRRTWNESADLAELGADAPGPNGADQPRTLTGAWCYLCRKPITTWSGRWPITETARIEVELHRKDHIRDAPDGVTSSTQEKP